MSSDATHDLTVALGRRLDTQREQECRRRRPGVAALPQHRMQPLIGQVLEDDVHDAPRVVRLDCCVIRLHWAHILRRDQGKRVVVPLVAIENDVFEGGTQRSHSETLGPTALLLRCDEAAASTSLKRFAGGLLTANDGGGSMAAPRTRHGRRPSPAERLVAADRVRFLTEQPLDPRHVRRAILASWQRSHHLSVVADHIRVEQVTDLDIQSPLVRSSEPVLRDLKAHLDTQAMSIILTDSSGLVLSRQSGDGELDRYLDAVQLAPGFRYAESNVGTNGIGTALEVGGPAYVFGHEHYAEDLESLSCAAVPIRHPISGRTVGTIDLTCWSRDAGPLLLVMAKATADQIRHALLLDAGTREIALVQEYLRTCRRLPGIVFALKEDTVILNEHIRTTLTPTDQSALVAHATESLLGGPRRSLEVVLPSGTVAHMYGTPVGGDDNRAMVIHARLGTVSRRAASDRSHVMGMALPGVVGSDPLWLRTCREVAASAADGAWVVVRGEPGAGRLTVASAAHQRQRPFRKLGVLDVRSASSGQSWGARVTAALGGGEHDLVIRNVNELDASGLREVEVVLAAARHRAAYDLDVQDGGGAWVAVTTTPGFEFVAGREVGRLFPRTVDVPPLRLHAADVEPLVRHFLGRLGVRESLVCPPSIMAILTRNTWKGNAQEVQDVLREVVTHRRAGTLTVDDLPPRARANSRRQLTPLETIERDTIIQAIIDSGGDKGAAAASVGMSRATIYRKIQHFGIRMTSS